MKACCLSMLKNMNNIWILYRARLSLRMATIEGASTLEHSQNTLFIHIITFFLPFSLLAIVPGVILSLINNLILLPITEVAAFSSIAYSAFSSKLSITFKKAVFVAVIHMVALVLILTLGSFGPGLLYLLAGTFFTVLIFPYRNGYWSTAAVVGICIILSLTLHFNLITTPFAQQYSVWAWLVVSCNAVFLSSMMVMLLPRLFKKIKVNVQRFERVCEASGDCIWDWNVKLERMDFNTGIAEMFGYTDAAAGKSANWWIENIHPDDRYRTRDIFSISVKNKSAATTKAEFRFLCADGSYKHVYNRSTVLVNEDGTARNIIGVVQDVSVVRRYITMIEKQNENLREISWIHSHKMRRPLANLMGLVRLIDHGQLKDPDDIELFRAIERSCVDLDDEIKEVTALSNLEPVCYE